MRRTRFVNCFDLQTARIVVKNFTANWNFGCGKCASKALWGFYFAFLFVRFIRLFERRIFSTNEYGLSIHITHAKATLYDIETLFHWTKRMKSILMHIMFYRLISCDGLLCCRLSFLLKTNTPKAQNVTIPICSFYFANILFTTDDIQYTHMNFSILKLVK